MKKFASLITAFALSSSLFAATQMQATVVSVSGKVEIQDKDDKSKWITVGKGATLEKGDVIQTGFKSELVLQIKGSTVTVSQLSRITLEQLVAKDDKDETRIFVDTGSLKSNVKKSEGRPVGFKVRSPSATASVRGTTFEVKNKFRSTEVKTYEGTVAACSSGKGKSNNAKPSIATEDEDNAPAIIQGSVTDGMPSNSFTVTKGQTAGFAKGGETASTQSNAVSKAFALPSSTTSASSTEKETVIATSPSIPTAITTTTAEKEKATISVNIQWE